MAIPDFQSIFWPILELASDQKEHATQEAHDVLADHYDLNEEERRELLPSGGQKKFKNRVSWAKFYLEKAGIFVKTKRAHFQITERGLEIFAQKPEPFNVRFLANTFPEFKEFHQRRPQKNATKDDVEEVLNQNVNPEEALETAFHALKSTLSGELLQTVKDGSPAFFEQLVVDLLVKMGYGGSRKEAGMAIGKSGDEGIDGIIKEDRLGLDVIYIQAKRYTENTIGRPDIQKFAGALQGQRAKKGIFITTTKFSRDAHEYVKNIDTKIILINGEELADLMIDHNVGVTPITAYEVKKIDQDYFEEA